MTHEKLPLLTSINDAFEKQDDALIKQYLEDYMHGLLTHEEALQFNTAWKQYKDTPVWSTQWDIYRQQEEKLLHLLEVSHQEEEAQTPSRETLLPTELFASPNVDHNPWHHVFLKPSWGIALAACLIGFIFIQPWTFLSTSWFKSSSTKQTSLETIASAPSAEKEDVSFDKKKTHLTTQAPSILSNQNNGIQEHSDSSVENTPHLRRAETSIAQTKDTTIQGHVLGDGAKIGIGGAPSQQNNDVRVHEDAASKNEVLTAKPSVSSKNSISPATPMAAEVQQDKMNNIPVSTYSTPSELKKHVRDTHAQRDLKTDEILLNAEREFSMGEYLSAYDLFHLATQKGSKTRGFTAFEGKQRCLEKLHRPLEVLAIGQEALSRPLDSPKVKEALWRATTTAIDLQHLHQATVFLNQLAKIPSEKQRAQTELKKLSP